MKRIFILAIVALLTSAALNAQSIAYIDGQYILSNIPEYKTAQDKISSKTQDWQKEIQAEYDAVESLYKDYQSKRVSMSEAEQRAAEDKIIAREDAAKELQKKYFGAEGELAKMQQELISPISEKINEAVRTMAVQYGYDLVIDSSEGSGILYSNPKNDKSDIILELLKQ